TNRRVLDVDVAHESIGAPADVEMSLLRQALAAVGVGHQNVLERTLGSLGGVAVCAKIHIAAGGSRLIGEGIAGPAAIDRGTLRGIIGEAEAGFEAAVERLLVEIVV